MDTFLNEIKNLMYGYGDCENPFPESVALMNRILCEQMKSLIILAGEAANLRGESIISFEDILYLLSKNKKKLRRLLKQLEIKTMRFKILENLSFGLAAAKSAAEAVAEKTVPRRISTLQKCLDFLNEFDETGELSGLLQSGVYDEIWVERAKRRDRMTSSMSLERFQEYVSTREQSGFTGFRSLSTFEAWLNMLNDTNIKINRSAAELISHLANETVIQIVDLALIVKQDCGSNRRRDLNQPRIDLKDESSMSDAPESSTEESSANNNSLEHITTYEILEAVTRYTQPSGPFCPFNRTHCMPPSRNLFCL